MPDFGFDPVSALGLNPTPDIQAPPDYAALLGYGAPAATTAPTPSPDLGTPAPGPVTTIPSEPGPANVPQPDIAKPAPGLLPGQSVSAKAGVSQSGFSPAAFAATQKLKPGLETDLAKDRASAEAGFAPIQAEQQAATEKGLSAIDQTAEIQSKQLAAQAEGKTKIAQANHDFLVKEQAAADNGRAEADHAQAQYRAALMDYAAAKINPAQLWESAGQRGQFGMIATAFAHDFLGAKGIQTSGMDSIKSAIQNNINSQLENMRKKQDVASGFKQLWDMQRAQSATDTEARQRLNGFYLQALTNQIDAQLGSYDSPLAIAKAQTAKAALLQEQVKNDLSVRQHIDQSANARTAQRVQVFDAQLAASAARYSADAHLKAAELAAGKKDDPRLGVIYDTSVSGKNMADRRFLPGVPPEEQVKQRIQNASKLNTAENINHLIDLQEQMSRVPPGNISLINRLQGEANRTAETIRNAVKMRAIYDNSGKQINEQETKIYDDIFAKKDWFLNGEATRPLAAYAKMEADNQKRIMSSISTKIQPSDPMYGTTTGDNTTDPGNTALLDIRSQPGHGAPQEGDTDVAVQHALDPDGLKAYDLDKLPEKGPGSKAAVAHDWTKFVADQPWAAPQTDTDFDRRRGGASPIINPKQMDAAADKNNPDAAFIQLEKLADLALAGDSKARDTIDQWAKGHPSTADAEGLLAAYAQWEKSTKGL